MKRSNINNNNSNQSIYLMECNNTYKIGISNNPIKRYNTFLTGNPNIKLICYSEKISFAYWLEAKLHKLFKLNKVKGEWFRLTNLNIETLVKLLSNLSELDYDNICFLLKDL